MLSKIHNEMNKMICQYIQMPEIKELVLSFSKEQFKLNLHWSKLTLYSHWMFEGKSEHIHKVAAITELIFLASDILDDIQDQDHLSKPWMKHSKDTMFNMILIMVLSAISEFNVINKQTNTISVNKVNQLIIQSIGGQEMDIKNRVDSEEEYFSMLELKSSSLIRLACYTGYSFSNHNNENQTNRLDELAGLAGIIHQLENDINDIIITNHKNDLLHKKRTLPVLFLLKHSNEFPIIKDYYDGEITKEQFLEKKNEVNQIIQDSGCIEYSKVIQNLYINKFDELFESLEAVSPWKEHFRDLVYTTE
ncbi:polyprenyl synthetase family protein [Chengkuizengella axinellae]|uniref:Polyprenyl synthetase family protein n=1 Tax=Chengkuizengella axinellae TaxID=3064388 RepID=A0ABT9J5F5_9BACL|nr:polyprenyl synthetase family protein [Chengkuizengella sp. 2205SS18-9]MDP5276798.1 polyprenyl synthetase family protein [Chengkuizengella sp. 2205SS18-9]